MVTKANPRGRPVSRSIISLDSMTVPHAANVSFRSVSVVLKERFPTNSLLLIYVLLSGLAVTFSRRFPTTGFKIIIETEFT